MRNITDNAKVTIVIPCFNCSTTIGRAVHSVVQDAHPNREIIAVNDGSDDGTAEHLAKLTSMHHGVIRVIHQDRRGANVARNRGLEEATGDYIQFLDADDYICENKLARSVRAMHSDDNIMCVYTDHKIFGDDSELFYASHDNIEAIINRTFREFTFGMNTNMPLWRHQFLRSTGQKWDQDLVCWQESEYYFRLLLALDSTAQIVHLPFPGFVRATDSESISSGWRSSRYIRGKAQAILKIHRLCQDQGLDNEALQSQVDRFMWLLYKTAVLHGADDVLSLLKTQQGNKPFWQRAVHTMPAAWIRRIHRVAMQFRMSNFG